MWLIVGLGNPGEEYAKTRHNLGFQCVSHLAARHRLAFSGRRAKAQIAEGQIAGQRVVLAQPFTFMNLIGHAVVGLCQWYKVAPERELLIIYDDLDLPFATLRLREKGGPGTHNGMKSVVGQLGTQAFPRLRVGIDQGPAGRDAAAYVLNRFSTEEEHALPQLYDQVAEVVELILREGFTPAMNRYNRSAAPSSENPSSSDT